MLYKYKHAVLGGTFDHLHAGHKYILAAAFDSAKHITIGVTSDAFVTNKQLSNIIQPHTERKQVLEKYLLSMNVRDRASYEVLDDIYGSATNRDDIDSIVVTSDSEPNANTLNEKRVEHNLPKLYVINVPLLHGKDGETISSTRIRQGVINRNGEVYIDNFVRSDKHTVPQNIRKELQFPMGTVMSGSIDTAIATAREVVKKIGEMHPTMVIAVGDIIVQTLEQAGFQPHIEIIDYRTRRSDIKRMDGGSNFDVANPAGTITKEAVNLIDSAILKARHTDETQRIVIQGEEDLLALPAILLAPLKSVIIYGQFDVGIVMVEVNEFMKKKVAGIIEQFE
ncbi:hypothetical protein CO051_03445 [Candidatus Roizmanbacteria bacterium CG_4_9_14_0_2_um_filter_39_13]|uniref:Cytidyltransferase-like domain-containing protein n=1 Tax=Candidatus Roizmanbacteria bacterium CG_4_9_14_0_2_um_filter_39_13 TaxID=1974839 RepID=A0A2M8EZB4_9BACT|nr:MAG: hypothetical protein COY15_05315 [Candidatus Roizmanbacteria bacterium CG_4_10_14_0_2_um_filter_39_12]PJC32253.1 MAG: hypothetical protein CO051_03445 [Candidatus Roizmanbacteria bacterium CG_4_9_14_0_2_um_filter_39_13]